MKNSFITFIEERIISVTFLFSILMCIYPFPSIVQLILFGVEGILAIVIVVLSLTRDTEILIKLLNYFTLFSMPVNFNLVRRAVVINNPDMQMPLIKLLYTISVNNMKSTSDLKNILEIFIIISVPIIFLTLYKILLTYDRFSTKIHEFSLYVSQASRILKFNTIVLGILSGLYLLIRIIFYVFNNIEITQQILAIEFSMWPIITFILFYPLIMVVLSIGLFLGWNSIKTKI